MSHLAILGASGHGKVVADTARLNPKWQKISFFDDAWPIVDRDFPWPIIGTTQELLSNLDQFSGVIVGIGDNAVRQQKQHLMEQHAAPLVTIIHPQAYVSKDAIIGKGSIICAQAVISIHANIGSGCIINTAASIDHDCKLAAFIHISPGANLGGNVTIGERSWIGIGSVIRQGINIGSQVIVGAGGAVVKNIDHQKTVVGVPAQPLIKG